MAVVTRSHSKYSGILVNKTDVRKLKEGLKADIEEVCDFIISRFNQIGVECVKIARDSGRYNDITGNLRSSIGYVVLRDGKPVHDGGFVQTRGYGENTALVRFTTKAGKKVSYRAKGKSGDGSQGVAEGKAFLQKLQAEYPQGISLIVCAGMNYAAYVEYHKDLDVLHSAEQTAERLLDELLRGVITEK